MQCMMSHTQTSRSPDWGGRGKEGAYRSRSLQRGPPKEKLFVSGPCLPLGQWKSQTMQIKSRCSLAGLKSQGSGQKHTHFWLESLISQDGGAARAVTLCKDTCISVTQNWPSLNLWVPGKMFCVALCLPRSHPHFILTISFAQVC